ncbi:hypothetical protein CTI12_AA197910 [Artemisia annua]|uniref:Ulp1 protease family, C-terminal catalytic domain-containing protein n=1 Tax=Artemisia annua TaxID=35608 RepID=A0A2U1P2Z2_ARTAN|nr:hypothetical protein CTI12_AA197910 [Artemisia annua]
MKMLMKEQKTKGENQEAEKKVEEEKTKEQAEKEGDAETKEDASKSEEKANGKRKIDENQNDKDAKNKVNEEIDENEKKKRKVYTMLSGRETIKPLFEAMHGLSIERKKEVLGLPKGSRRLERNEGQREKNDRFKEEWKDQYKDETKLTISAISKQITKTTNTNFIFRMNFLMLVANTFGTCDKSSVAKTTVLENVIEEDNVTEIDWCGYVYECARSSKSDWATRKRDRTEIVYYGPVTFLMLAYLQYTKFDAMNVPRRLPAFKSWNANLLISRETLELDRIKYFGMVDIIGGLNEEEQTAQKEEIYQMLEDKIESILSEKELFDETIKDTIFKFGNDQRINEYRERLNEIFMNPNGKFKQRSPIYSSSTESSSIKFATSDDENDNNGDEKAECGDENKEHGNNERTSNTRDEAAGNKDVSSSKKDIAAENNDVSRRQKDEKLNEGEKIRYEMKHIDDVSIFDEIVNKTDEELKKEYREMKEKEEKSAPKKLEDLTDEEFLEVFQEAEWKKFENQTNVEEIQKEQAGESSQKEKEKEEAGPSSCNSREHSFEFTPGGSQPSFNLGFDTPEEQSKKFNKAESNEEKKQNRLLESPYINEKVSTTEELTEDEILLARSIFSMQGNEAEQVFKDQEVVLMRMNVQSLAPGLKIETPQLPGILQNEPQCMLTKIDKQYDEFAKMITIQMEDDIKKLQFEDVNLRGVFAKHLKTYQHPKGDELMNQKRKATILNMSWRTKKEKIDCGLYMMLHMEYYQGKSETKWDTGMLKENDINHRMQINNLRAKYVAKMMLHEVNDNQKMMSDYALKFAAENPDEEAAKT